MKSPSLKFFPVCTHVNKAPLHAKTNAIRSNSIRKWREKKKRAFDLYVKNTVTIFENKC